MFKFVCISLAVFLTAVVSFGNIIDNLQAHQWCEIPNTNLSAVYPSPMPAGNTGPTSIMLAWSGGGFDTKRDRLIIWGGGHGDYSGNEIYTFDLNTLQWRRETDPSPDVSGPEGGAVYPPWNGKIQPRSRHTYDYVTYLASMDRFCSFGASAQYPSGGIVSPVMHCFNFDTKLWENRSATPGYGIDALSAYDPVTGHGWVQGTDSHSYIAEFFPESTIAGKWKTRGGSGSDFSYDYSLTMACDPVNRKLVSVGGGHVYYYDISNPAGGVTRVAATTSGATGLTGASDPGLDYDPVTQKIVGWSSDQTVYSLDVPTKVWTSTNGTGANPGSPAQWGTYGRFRYSPGHNVFVIVNTTTSNVFAYRHTPGLGAVEARAINEIDTVLSVRPNPFNPSAEFTVHLAHAVQDARFYICDMNGKVVSSLVKGRMDAGTTVVPWNARAFGAGAYIAVLKSPEGTHSRRLFLAR